MKNKLTTLVLMSSLVLGGLAAGTIAEAAVVTSHGDVQFKAGSGENNKPHDPEKEKPEVVTPDPEIDPEVVYPKGPLRLHHVPSLSFGVNEIKADGDVLDALLENVVDGSGTLTPRASFVEVADERGTLKGWKVTVQSDGVFTSAKGDIEGTITFSAPAIRGINGMETKPEAAPIGEGFTIGKDNTGTATVLTAAEGKGYNIWQARYGKSDTAVADAEGILRNGNVKLTLPKGQMLMADVKYRTTLNWSLEEAP